VLFRSQIVGGVVGSWALDKIGRKLTWVIGCLGTAVFIAPIGFLSGLPLQIMVITTGFFISFAYTWIVVYIPEVFPTERRGACLGWTTTVTRVSYVIGPIIAAVLLSFFPSMDWYWVITGAIMIIPAIVIIFIKPYETQKKTLEEIESHT
jgi:AAHS family cis,cis-muconate transporter-like MFS transporter